MTVQELIDKLQKVQNKNLPVEFADNEAQTFYPIKWVFADEAGVFICDVPPTWDFAHDELTEMEVE